MLVACVAALGTIPTASLILYRRRQAFPATYSTLTIYNERPAWGVGFLVPFSWPPLSFLLRHQRVFEFRWSIYLGREGFLKVALIALIPFF